MFRKHTQTRKDTKASYLPSYEELQLLMRKAGDREDACLELLWLSKFGASNITCPQCKFETVFTLKMNVHNKLAYRCNHIFCQFEVNLKENTIFAHSKLSLQTWFKALYLLYSNENIPLQKISREAQVSWPTARDMRAALTELME